MGRGAGQWLEPRRTLTATLVILGITASLPARYLAWAGWFGTLAQTLAAPISHPVTRFVRWVSPADSRLAADQEGAQVWRRRAEEFETLYLREQSENQRLRHLVDELQSNIGSGGGRVEVRLLAAPVIGASSDLASGLLALRAPRESGITPGTTIAVVEGVQVLGRVDSVRGWVPMVRPISDRSAGRVEGVVVLADSRDAPRLRCSLTPRGDGTLSGPVEDESALQGAGVGLAVGQRVRLSDAAWPASAQQLVLGEVVRIEPNPDQPLRRMVVVRPMVDLARVSEVVLRIPLAGGVVGDDRPTGDPP